MVAPVRWATPGTEVDCAISPWASRQRHDQSTSTPPPCPPIASTAMAVGRRVSSRGAGVIVSTISGDAAARRRATTLQKTDRHGAQALDSSIPSRIDDDVGPIKRRAEHGRLRHLAAIAAADARIVDRRDRLVLQRSAVCLTDNDGQPDRRMQAWSPVHILVDPKRWRTRR